MLENCPAKGSGQPPHNLIPNFAPDPTNPTSSSHESVSIQRPRNSHIIAKHRSFSAYNVAVIFGMELGLLVAAAISIISAWFLVSRRPGDGSLREARGRGFEDSQFLGSPRVLFGKPSRVNAGISFFVNVDFALSTCAHMTCYRCRESLDCLAGAVVRTGTLLRFSRFSTLGSAASPPQASIRIACP